MLQSLIKFKPETEEKICKYERITSFMIALYTSTCILSYYAFDNIFFLKIIIKPICVYLFCDLFIAKGDAIIHHALTLVCLYYYLKYFDTDYLYLHFLPSLKIEMSTVFLILKLWMDNIEKKSTFLKIVYSVNDGVFVYLFFKLRVYDCYYQILYNQETYDLINTRITDNVDKLFTYASFYSMFILNMYWFSIICKKLYKQIVIGLMPFLDKKSIAECLLTISFCINFYIAYINYSVNMTPYHFLDLFGIFVLSIASGNYHYSKYKYLRNNPVANVTSDELLTPFIHDKYAIQMRSFLTLTTISLIKETGNKFIFLSIFYHVLSIVSFNMNVIKTLFENKQIIYDESESSKQIIKRLDIISSIPCLFDTILVICYHTNSEILKVESVTISMIIGLLLCVKPFYNLNHVFLHILSILQTICISKFTL